MPDPLLDAVLTPDERAAVRAPIERARTLPRTAFTSDAFFELERDRIFSRGWCALGLAEQVSEAGDLLPTDFCGFPLLLARGDDDVVRVFHNVVPYDACLAVLDACRGAREIVAPYHGWRYDLRGRLLATPYWDGTKQSPLAALGERSGDLAEVRCHTAFGVVFIDLSGSAGAFEEFAAPLTRALSEYRLDELAIGADASGDPAIAHEDLPTNWKTHLENWGINVLHESFVHELYAHARDASGEIPRVDAHGAKTYVDHIDAGFLALRYFEKDFQGTYPALPMPHLGVGAPPELGFFGSLFPNLHFGVFSQTIHWIVSLPDGPGRTRTVNAQFYDAQVARDPEYLEARTLLHVGMGAANAEDGQITAAVQRARQSPAFSSAFYSPFWDEMHHAFSGRVLDALEQGR